MPQDASFLSSSKIAMFTGKKLSGPGSISFSMASLWRSMKPGSKNLSSALIPLLLEFIFPILHLHFPDSLQQFHNNGSGTLIEGSCRPVKEQKPWLPYNRPYDIHPLLLSAAEGCRVSIKGCRYSRNSLCLMPITT